MTKSYTVDVDFFRNEVNHLLEKSKKKLRKKLLIDSTGRTKNNK